MLFVPWVMTNGCGISRERGTSMNSGTLQGRLIIGILSTVIANYDQNARRGYGNAL